ncbi:MAG: Coenzyme F420 hydrogenase/dehydrogenase, beta subunit C-terminal domain [Dethiobacteria bacterium]
MIVKHIKKKKHCVGCFACFSICPQSCISMDSDEEGFWYPQVDYDKCIECNLCIQVCPILNKISVQNQPKAYACINNDETIRLESSSGGIFTLIAEQVIEDGGVVFGATFNEDFEVEHIFVESCEELSKLRGSKYVQSKIGESFKQAKKLLDLSRKVLFTGTPCQIGGLKSYLGKPYDGLLCADLICHGVPSPLVWRKYVDYRQEKAGSFAQKISFRRKNDGWKRFSISFSFKNDTEYREPFDQDLYMRAFLNNICLRPSCYDCRFKTIHRQSDLTLADFWGIQSLLPDMDDDKGTSLVWVSSEAGHDMIKKIASKMQIQEVDILESIKYNPSAIESVRSHPNRKKFFEELHLLPFDELVKKYCTVKLSTRLKKKIKDILIKQR